MKRFSALGQKLVLQGDGQFGTVHNYQCDGHAIEYCFDPGFFNSVYDRLLIGDSVHIIEIVDNRVTRSCYAMVTEKNAPEIVVQLESKIVEYRETLEIEDVPEFVQEGPKYITGDAKVKWNPGKKSYDVVLDNEVVATFKKRSEADSVARGDEPIPELIGAA